jgi:serine/threonine protein kinase
MQDFVKEAVIWQQLRHPNVLPFYGLFHFDSITSWPCLVSPWMENGNIMQFLELNPDTNHIPLVRLTQ